MDNPKTIKEFEQAVVAAGLNPGKILAIKDVLEGGYVWVALDIEEFCLGYAPSKNWWRFITPDGDGAGPSLASARKVKGQRSSRRLWGILLQHSAFQ